jgi:hypothetical protein
MVPEDRSLPEAIFTGDASRKTGKATMILTIWERYTKMNIGEPGAMLQMASVAKAST